ncbi:hypothetical protein Ae406Ps2_3254c [Pseudonocardia sp. Ae406_Ps2]|nr:hypothetical protein Ae331Ps2_2674 [Pseudonocardia sp. Ae331_Ps2]OLM02263.1 hypothetical protein Ae406Ps2_2263c [Pseudonocardia sp. Ae406_Ps2]OLM23835.1 hypothetical protein Ae706Ps2_2268c [Pseudonocardia sp. Ae706_Ps2]OLL99994.1 hypothetical protein Ae331Ps2_3661 [Pseudonocardia sp. Ae331_Ps2]OLL99997.1 hypothetical protein Ae331Ps2_3664 [Pseudonocardia sp. Ae331_Ps2]
MGGDSARGRGHGDPRSTDDAAPPMTLLGTRLCTIDKT